MTTDSTPQLISEFVNAAVHQLSQLGSGHEYLIKVDLKRAICLSGRAM